MQNENEHTYDNGFHPKKVHLNENYTFYNLNIFFRFFSWFAILFTRIWLIFPTLFLGMKIKGKKNKRKVKGAIMISNHIHPLDAFYLASTALFGKKIYITMLETNLGFGLVSSYIRLAAAVPIPTERRQIRRFNEATAKILKKNKIVLFYPEAALMPYCNHIRNFLPGGFHYAYENNVPILPCCFTFHKPSGLRKLFRKKPIIHCTFLEPYFIKPMETKRETIENATKEVQQIMSNFFVENSDYYYENSIKKEV